MKTTIDKCFLCNGKGKRPVRVGASLFHKMEICCDCNGTGKREYTESQLYLRKINVFR